MKVWKEAELASLVEEHKPYEVLLPSDDALIVSGRKYETPIHFDGVDFKFHPDVKDGTIQLTDKQGESRVVSISQSPGKEG
jgi:hypothetical protein